MHLSTYLAISDVQYFEKQSIATVASSEILAVHIYDICVRSGKENSCEALTSQILQKAFQMPHSSLNASITVDKG